MTAGDRKIAVALSLLMTASVAFNLVAFQEKRQAVSDAPASARTSWIEGPGVTLASATNAAPKLTTEPGTFASPEGGSADPAETTRAIQRELNSRGYEAGQPDGVAGTVTRAAIFAYEYDGGLVLSGRPSEALLSQVLLGSSSIAPTSVRQSRTLTPDGELFVKGVKQQLTALGYQTGSPGSALTPEFAGAIRKFESDQKLKDSGRISAPMMSRIIRLQGEAKAKRSNPAKTAAR